MTEQAPPQEDRRQKQAAAAKAMSAKKQAAENVANEMKNAGKLNRERADIAKAKLDHGESTAKKLDQTNPWQTVIESKLTPKTTEMLGAAIRHCAATEKQSVLWACVSKEHARDVMQRAYPLGLQMGIMGVPNEQKHQLAYPNGSVIDFHWPDKPSASTIAR